MEERPALQTPRVGMVQKRVPKTSQNSQTPSVLVKRERKKEKELWSPESQTVMLSL